METSEYVTGRRSHDGAAVGEAHAVLLEASRGDGPFRAECGEQVEVTEGPWPPDGPDAAGPCPACSRVTGLDV